MYKDKDQQKQASKERVRRYRAKKALQAKGVTSEGVTKGGIVIPEGYTSEGLEDAATSNGSTRAKIAARIATVKPSDGTEQDNIRAASDKLVAALGGPAIVPNIDNYGEPDCQCQHCQGVKVNSSKHILNHGPHRPASVLAKNELNRVSLPGDVDYAGVCLQTGQACVGG